MKKRTGRLRLNRETLRRLDDLSWVQAGGATGTCAGSGCPECPTMHGSGCMSKAECYAEEEVGTVVMDIGVLVGD